MVIYLVLLLYPLEDTDDILGVYFTHVQTLVHLECIRCPTYMVMVALVDTNTTCILRDPYMREGTCADTLRQRQSPAV